MTTSGICELFHFASQTRKNGSASITSGWRMACALFVLCTATAIVSPEQTFRTLESFDGTNGSYPTGSLVQGLDGSFYGTTLFGGAYGEGTVFRITPSGTLTTLHSFCSQSGALTGNSPLRGWFKAPTGTSTGRLSTAGLRLWYGLQNHRSGQVNHASQLLCPNELL